MTSYRAREVDGMVGEGENWEGEFELGTLQMRYEGKNIILYHFQGFQACIKCNK